MKLAGLAIIAAISLCMPAYAQFPHEFINTAHNIHHGTASNVAVGPDGTVFLANYGGGLRAYSYDGSSFTGTAHIDDGGQARGVAVGPDGTVFLANDNDGLRAYIYTGFVTGVDISSVPGTIALAQNYPNPFNPLTGIAFALSEQSAVSMQVYDVSGRLVRVLLDREITPAGRHETVWDGRDDAGRLVASGTYLYRLETGQFRETKAMVLVR